MQETIDLALAGRRAPDFEAILEHARQHGNGEYAFGDVYGLDVQVYVHTDYDPRHDDERRVLYTELADCAAEAVYVATIADYDTFEPGVEEAFDEWREGRDPGAASDFADLLADLGIEYDTVTFEDPGNHKRLYFTNGRVNIYETHAARRDDA